MIPIGTHNYFVYILTNKNRTVLYTGVSNDLKFRLYQHKQDAMGIRQHFTGKYQVYYLLYWERFEYVIHAFEREKEIKGWKRSKKIDLINSINPNWDFLNDQV
jgi:putative endonuclease